MNPKPDLENQRSRKMPKKTLKFYGSKHLGLVEELKEPQTQHAWKTQKNLERSERNIETSYGFKHLDLGEELKEP
jgi:hypothetical protein